MIEKASYDEQFKRFCWACDWIESYGIKLNSSRLAIYRRDLADLVAHEKAGTTKRLEKKRTAERLTNSLLESQELIDIYSGLKNCEDAALPDELKKFIRGPELRSLETPQTSLARNTGFHLWFAAMAKKCLVPTRLLPPTDVLIRVGSDWIAVECKRLFSPRNVEDNVSTGFHQLQARYGDHRGNAELYGALAISLGKLDDTMIEVEDEAQLKVEGVAKINRFAEEHRRHWLNRSTGREITVFLYWNAPVRVQRPYLLTIGTQFNFFPLCERDETRGFILRSVMDSFNQLTT